MIPKKRGGSCWLEPLDCPSQRGLLLGCSDNNKKRFANDNHIHDSLENGLEVSNLWFHPCRILKERALSTGWLGTGEDHRKRRKSKPRFLESILRSHYVRVTEGLMFEVPNPVVPSLT